MYIRGFLVVVCAFTLLTSCKNIEIEYDVLKTFSVSSNMIGDVIGTDRDLPIVKNRGDENFLIVEIYSKQNYWQMIENSGAVLYVESRFCAKPHDPVILGLPHLYSLGFNVSTGPHLQKIAPKHLSSRSEQEMLSYQIVIFQSWQDEIGVPLRVELETGFLTYRKYDLVEHPQDICLDLILSKGPRVISSAELRLPASEIPFD